MAAVNQFSPGGFKWKKKKKNEPEEKDGAEDNDALRNQRGNKKEN